MVENMAEVDSGSGEGARPKVRMPAAKDLGRADFKPHGIAGGKRPPKKPPTRPARRRAILAIGAVVVLALAGAGVVTAEALKPSDAITVKGAFGKAPTMTFPKVKPKSGEHVKRLIAGTGPTVVKGNLIVANFVGYIWSGKTHKVLNNTYQASQNGPAQPLIYPAGKLTDLPALDKALVGQKAGTRMLVQLPGTVIAAATAKQLGLKKGDALVFSADVTATFPASVSGTSQPVGDAKLPAVTDGGAGRAPTLKIPSSSPAPTTLISKTLIQGTGPVVQAGQTLVTNYVGQIWKTGKVFDSSWQRGQPAPFTIGKGQVIPGWDKTLVGQKVGSRVLLVIPPKDGYGSQGASAAGIKGTDTLVFVIDILGHY
jgi:FKBP-type peptidyl-prolyl cis-trans isomerase 2